MILASVALVVVAPILAMGIGSRHQRNTPSAMVHGLVAIRENAGYGNTVA
jgi:hypothetical protein